MATMNVSLPSKMKQWIEEQVASGRYSNVSDYVRDLVREAQDEEKEREAAIAEIQALIDEGLASGVVDVDLDEMRAEVKREMGLDRTSDAA